MFARRRIFIDASTQEVVCRSANGVFGVGQPGGACEVCGYAKWTGDQAAGNRRAPLCNFMYSYIVYVKEWQQAAILDFKKTNLPVGKTLNTLVARFGLGQFNVTLQAIAQTNTQKQRYFVMSLIPNPSDENLQGEAQQVVKITL
jgi:hypothetical protein